MPIPPVADSAAHVALVVLAVEVVRVTSDPRDRALCCGGATVRVMKQGRQLRRMRVLILPCADSAADVALVAVEVVRRQVEIHPRDRAPCCGGATVRVHVMVALRVDEHFACRAHVVGPHILQSGELAPLCAAGR